MERRRGFRSGPAHACGSFVCSPTPQRRGSGRVAACCYYNLHRHLLLGDARAENGPEMCTEDTCEWTHRDDTFGTV
jgi:hypothetical protein